MTVTLYKTRGRKKERKHKTENIVTKMCEIHIYTRHDARTAKQKDEEKREEEKKNKTLQHHYSALSEATSRLNKSARSDDEIFDEEGTVVVDATESTVETCVIRTCVSKLDLCENERLQCRQR